MTTESIGVVKIDANLCIGCGSCVKECPSRCIKVTDGVAVFSKKACIACGHCAAVCPVEAIQLFGKPVEKTSNYSLETVADANRMRRSVRQFSGSLENDYIKNLLNETRHCASACNFRPLKFLVLNRAKMDELTIPAATFLDIGMPGMLAGQ